MKSKLQAKLKEKNLGKTEQQLNTYYAAIAASHDIKSINTSIKNILEIYNKIKISTENLTSFTACISKYIQVLKLIPSTWSQADIKIIEEALHYTTNIESDRAKVLALFAVYEALPLTSQSKGVSSTIKEVYKKLDFKEAFSSGGEKLLSALNEAITMKAFILANIMYDCLKYKSVPDSFLQFPILQASIDNQEFTLEDFKKLFKALDINLRTLTFNLNQGKEDGKAENSANVSTIIIPYIHEIWQNDGLKAKSLLEYFIQQGLPCKSNIVHMNALMLSMHCEPINLDLIKTLLELNVSDINALITLPSDGTQLLQTAFSYAVGKMDFNLLSLLLEHGADPYLANNIATLTLREQYGENIEVRLSAHLKDKLPLEKDRLDYWLKLDEFVENFYLTKLTNAQKEVEYKSQASVSTSSITDLPVSKLKSQSDKDELIEKQHSIDTGLAKATFDQYIKYKQGVQQSSTLPEKKVLEHKFDFLLLNWFQSNNSEYLDSLNTLLAENPDLNGYSATCLLNSNVSAEIVNNDFARNPKLLDKFFTLKKQGYHSTKVEAEVVTLQNNVYEVQGNFTNKIFIKVSESALEKLGNDNKTKVLSQLSDIHFIKSSSHGMPGIKSYPGCIKLKIPRTDLNLYATERCLDQKGNILIIFDKVGNHKDTPYNNKFISTIYEDFTQTIYKVELASSTNNSNAPISYSSVLNNDGFDFSPYNITTTLDPNVSILGEDDNGAA